MNEPLITAVIPTYNYGRFVVTAVESALVQTYANLEVIVVDDGSTDDTRQRLTPYLDRIRYIHQDNGGLSAARNAGIRAAAGEWIALLDADDVWHPRKLELQMRCLRAQPKVVGLLATELFTDQRTSWPALDETRAEVVHFGLEDVLGPTRFGPSSSLIRKSCLEAAGLFDSSLRSVEDRDMWIRLASRCTLAKLSLPLLFYRIHAASLSNKCAAMEQYELQVLAKAFAQIPALRGRALLRWQTYSLAAFGSAQVFRSNGHRAAALKRLLWSFLYWPLPLRVQSDSGALVRPRVMLNLLLRMLGLRAPETSIAAKAVATPPPLPPLPKPAAQKPDNLTIQALGSILSNLAPIQSAGSVH
jgi:glycosyltransferase involved in cell wall biosynthesis